MKKDKQQRLFSKSFYVVLVSALVVILYIPITIFFLSIKDTSASYSLFQHWKEYYSVEDWNMTMHAVTDIDGDGKNDVIVFSNCAFLSSVNQMQIPENQRCMEPSMAGITFPERPDIVGQRLGQNSTLFFNWMRKSYLVKTQRDEWRYYDMNGFRLRVFRLRADNLFEQVIPTPIDWLDLLTYQLSHVGVGLIMASLFPLTL